MAQEDETAAIETIYAECRSVSIDYGIMEKAKNVYVISADIGWSDLGTWGSIYTHLDQDEDGNAVVGKNVMLYDSKDCIVSVPKEKLVVLQGLKRLHCSRIKRHFAGLQKERRAKNKTICYRYKTRKRRAIYLE